MVPMIFSALGVLLSAAVSVVVSSIQADRKIKRIRDELEAKYRGQRRVWAIQVWDALRYNTELLRDQLRAVEAKFRTPGGADEMTRWFAEIKDAIHQAQSKDAAAFSAKCHYHLVFAMTTLYFTAVYFRYARAMRRLLSFSGLSPSEQALRRDRLTRVAAAFARTGTEAEGELHGLWLPVQDDMGMSVRREREHLSYSEFCRIFAYTSNQREDHVYLRAVDFFGADRNVSEGARSGMPEILHALDELLALASAGAPPAPRPVAGDVAA